MQAEVFHERIVDIYLILSTHKHFEYRRLYLYHHFKHKVDTVETKMATKEGYFVRKLIWKGVSLSAKIFLINRLYKIKH